MSQAIVNPQELRQFAANLKQFNNDLQAKSSSINGQFNHLGETWRDQQHAAFAQEFAHTMQTIQKFIQISEQQIPQLLRKAELAEQYLQHRG